MNDSAVSKNNAENGIDEFLFYHMSELPTQLEPKCPKWL